MPDAAIDTTTTVSSVFGKALAFAQGPLDALRGTSENEKLLKNAKDEYVEEAAEIAAYTAIETLAAEVGDTETAKLARTIRRDEERMAAFLLKQIPTLTKAVVRDQIPAAERRSASTSRRRRVEQHALHAHARGQQRPPLDAHHAGAQPQLGARLRRLAQRLHLAAEREVGERALLDLAHALGGHPQLLAHGGERLGVLVAVEAVAQLDDLALALGQRRDGLAHGLLAQRRPRPPRPAGRSSEGSRSPSEVSPSSPTGRSSEATTREASRISSIADGSSSVASAISSIARLAPEPGRELALGAWRSCARAGRR